ncbi:hypothetical protein F2P81_001449 [Scophthalmus maximus]|uniref:Membrane-spanning 4-domains subfamily A member 4A-like n=1 Tax=Scophthalmus maximus TaxID=52904 RepID=A0A6A4TMU9_SCOMX|nr:hypothetical protein F2P81_001449 [Scophthalmus maximus]
MIRLKEQDNMNSSDEAAVVEEGVASAAQSPLVAVTQIGLSAFQIICVGVLLAKGLGQIHTDVSFFISSLLVVIAGAVAVAAQNLHLPTVSEPTATCRLNMLRACLGMQIVACGASLFNMICILVKMDHMPSFCWAYYYDNITLHYGDICSNIESIHSHFYAEGVLIEAALLAISVTLAVYCCKVVNCCTPAPKMCSRDRNKTRKGKSKCFYQLSSDDIFT